MAFELAVSVVTCVASVVSTVIALLSYLNDKKE